MNGPSSPTFCRPQHLDRERLRRLVASNEFDDVCYHEAVVVAEGRAAPAFKLLAVTSDALLLFVLGSGGGGSASPSGIPSMSHSRIPFRTIARVERVSPAQTRHRGMMIHANSELFEIAVLASIESSQKRVFIATFEPSSRAFFYITRAKQLEFQKEILSMGVNCHLATGDLSDLLDDLLREFVERDDLNSRCELLDELAMASTCNQTLQKLCFQDQNRLTSAVEIGHVVDGLPGFLLDEIARASTAVRSSSEALLRYHLSLAQLLHRLLFGGHWVPERLRFFLHTPLDSWLRTLTFIPKITQALKTDSWRSDCEDLVDLQAALVLELQLLQEEASLVDQRGDVVTLSLLSGQHDEWIAKLFKRVAVLLSRTPREHELAAANGGSSWSLSLWRATSLLFELLQISSVKFSGELASMLRRHRRDYLDLYIRNPRFGRILESSTLSHLVLVASDLLEILDLLT